MEKARKMKKFKNSKIKQGYCINSLIPQLHNILIITHDHI